MEEPARIDELLTSRKQLLADMESSTLLLLRDNLTERVADSTIEFKTAPQPSFNKNFEVLAADVISMGERGYKELPDITQPCPSGATRISSTKQDIRI